MKQYMITYEKWLSSPVIDEKDKEELRSITDEEELKERFGSELRFGTGGLRGFLGLGSSRMNKYNVRKATAGFAAALLEKWGHEAKEKGIAIAWDSRHGSGLFAKDAALTMASFGIKAFLFDTYSATPLLSFTVRRLGCCAGIVITASHNPKEYNGYKAYDETGCQLSGGAAQAVVDKAAAFAIEDIRPMVEEDALCSGLLVYLGAEDVKCFTDRVLQEALPVDEEAKKALKVVYTPLHGVGLKPVTTVLKAAGYTDVSVVKEQMEPDGDFPTVRFPNPEIPEALTLALELAEEKQADLIVATDPDSDRLGFAARDDKGKMVLISGNQAGVLLLDYKLRRMKGQIPPHAALITTVVTGEQGPAVARDGGLDVRLTLTGFKNICGEINKMKADKSGEFFMAYEESFGYMMADHTNDKDGVSASLKTCEMAAWYKSQGKTIPQVLDEISQRLGYYFDLSTSYTMPGADGAQKIAAIAAKVRDLGADLMEGIVKTDDYGPGLNGLPPENLVRFTFADGSWIACRPSGTEPKIKFYYSIKGSSDEDCRARYLEKRAVIDRLVESF